MQAARFQPRLIPGLATVAGVALFVYLGLWQAGKAELRQAEIKQHQQRIGMGALSLTQSLVDPRQLQDFAVVVRGSYEPQASFFVDNRQEGGKPGLHLVTPLRIENSSTRVLVNRGWVPWGTTRSVLPSVSTPAGPVEVKGVAAVPSTKKFFLMPEHEDPNPQLWTRIDLQRFSKLNPGALQGVVVLQNADDAQDGLVRKWPPPEDRVAMHQSYSMQWFGMAAALVIFYGVASLRKREQA